MRSFLDSFDKAFLAFEGALLSYRASGRLYFNADEKALLAENGEAATRAIECIDLSGLAQSVRRALGRDESVFLLEILHRIEVPKAADIPDHDQMVAAGKTRWRVPGTRIEIALIEEGPRRGEYLFSRETVVNLQSFYEQTRNLPYKPGAMRRVAEVYDSLGYGEGQFYQAYVDSPIRLSNVVPFRWLSALPSWTKSDLAGLATWKWLTLVVLVAAGLASCIGVTLLSQRLAPSTRFAWVSTPLIAAIAALLVAAFITEQLRVGSLTTEIVGMASTVVTFAGLAIAAVVGCTMLGEAIVRSQQIRRRSMDAQLIRLLLRLIGLVVAIALLVECAARLGIPAYSVLAGLGIGGLAVALAAQDSLANLFASIVIMFEKPFRVGNWIKVGDNEGIVEDVGFRSTRIRTFYNSLISIPNSDVIKIAVDNFGARHARRQRFFLSVKYDTPLDKLREFIPGIRRLMEANEKIAAERQYINLNVLGSSSLDILIYFHLLVDDYEAELVERERVLLDLLDLAERSGVEYAFPTRTIHVEAAGPAPAELAELEQAATSH